MQLDRPQRRAARTVSLGTAMLGAAAAATVAVTHPAAAQSAIASALSAITCASSSACVSGTNTSTGAGVSGTSSKGIGVTGNGSSASGVKGTSTSLYGVHGVSTTNAGVFGQSTSGGAGVIGTTPARYGVYGYTSGSTGGYGVVGASVNGYGVYGSTTSGSGTGVAGLIFGSGTGSYGYSTNGIGLEGITENGDGLYSYASSGGTAAYLYSAKGYGLISYSNGETSIFGSNSSGNGADLRGSYIGIIGRAPASGGFPIVATDTASNNLFWVTGTGDVYYRGGLHNFARTASGAAVTSFSPQSTAPVVEDTGTAQLAGGTAVVRLDPTFAASIDMSSAYRVFVTPNGDTRGLFVATKTPTGFIVRESQAGHSTVSFDYRVVATALGKTGQRMSVATSATAAAIPQAALPAPAMHSAPSIPTQKP